MTNYEKMRILITGNLGYVGAELMKELRREYPDSFLIGLDTGYFINQITTKQISPEVYLDRQYYADVRKLDETVLENVDIVISLAAISNDPIGNKFERVTRDINFKANVELAKLAKKKGVTRFAFASSCSVYGLAEDSARTEESLVNPLTAYAKSKVDSEKELELLADDNFVITCYRFATACGFSDRLRLDLVLNDFITGAFVNKEITILSDGSPWRPLINVKDMSRALRWSIERDYKDTGSYQLINAGSNSWNYQVKDLALAIKDIMPEVHVSINQNAQPDKRSYKVSFDKFEKIAPNHQPQYTLTRTIEEFIEGLSKIRYNDQQFRNSDLIRLNVINSLLKDGILDSDLSRKMNPDIL